MGTAFRIELDELVVEGLDPRERAALGAAIERALARLVAESGPPPWLAAGGPARLPGGAYTARAGARAADIGEQVARALYGGAGQTGGE